MSRPNHSHEGFTLWFTGLSGAGKTTLATITYNRLKARGFRVELLDGDAVRTNLSTGLGYSREDRNTNIRRIGFVCELLSRNGVIVIVAAISPYRAMRDELKSKMPQFVEVYVECPLDVLVDRDVKGLYKRALAGELEHFTGISDPYEAPLNAEVVIHSASETPEQSADRIWVHILDRLAPQTVASRPLSVEASATSQDLDADFTRTAESVNR